ncbi:hypothetical protein BSLG_007440 [Batrachochytrium salamandrivorans]|nr:hypothetical protein BSLG_007440 [Batrachochytrium salamandrivorans]
MARLTVGSVKINGISASFVHLDPNENLVKSAKKGDFRSCPKLLLETMKKADDGELKILVPDGLKCPACYRSWNLVIDYILERPDVSVKFVGEAHSKTLQESSLVDAMRRQNSRQIYIRFEITIPRTVYHAYSANSDSMSSDMEISGTSDQGDTGDDSLSLKMIAVCSGELVEQFVHPDDPSKSVWVYSVRTAMDAASVILSVGPFEIIPIHGWGRPALPMARNTDSILPDEELLDAGVQRTGGEKGLIFVLPEYKRDIRVSTFFLSQRSYSSIVTGSTMVLARTDVWVLVGFSNWMTALFMKKMFGNNEFKYRQQQVKQECTNVGVIGANQRFSGAFMVRVQEPGGTFDTETFEQEDFMWNALLRKEKDIGAQSEAIVALSKIQSLASLNTITSFARDQSHFYHLRLLAVRSLSKFSDGEWISLLIKLICDAFIIRPKARTSPLGRAAGRSVLLASADIEEFEVSSRDKKTLSENSAFSHCVLTSDEQQSFKDAYAQVIRQLSRDKVLPSHRNAVTISCLESLLKWQLSGLLPISYMLFLGYSRDGNSIQIRQMAVDCLITLSAMCNEDINEYLMDMALHDQDSWFQTPCTFEHSQLLSISLYGHKPSVTIEHAVTWLSKQVILLAISVGKKIGPHTSSRMWLLFMRLFEMARTCAENDPDLSQLSNHNTPAAIHNKLKLTKPTAFVSPSTNANMMATVATSSTSISAHKANSASNSTILSTMVHTEASDKALAATTLTTHPATALGNSSEIALTSRTPLRMTFLFPILQQLPSLIISKGPHGHIFGGTSHRKASGCFSHSSEQRWGQFTPSIGSIHNEIYICKEGLSARLVRHPSQTAQSLSTPAPSISSKAASSAAPILLEAQSPERMILDELMIRKDAVIFLHPVDRSLRASRITMNLNSKSNSSTPEPPAAELTQPAEPKLKLKFSFK